jgi:serine/threonine protein phosphatase PrpC
MSENKDFIKQLLKQHNLEIGTNKMVLFDAFICLEENQNAAKVIIENQEIIMNNWKIFSRVKDIKDQSVKLPNATVGKMYEAKFEFIKLGWDDIVASELDGFEGYGLKYDAVTETLSGIPTMSGDVKINLYFRVKGESEDSKLHLKTLTFFVNANPKSLWVDKLSDKNDPYWKEDNTQEFAPLGNKHVVVSSKRGRSHANVGSFRDDDYAFKYFENTGWSVVAVSDGAGSAKYARKGSEIACKEVISFFETNFTESVSAEMDLLFKSQFLENEQKKETSPEQPESKEPQAEPIDISAATEPTKEISESISSKINKSIYKYLGNAAFTVHKALDKFAASNNMLLKDLHNTLIYALYKKYDFGYVILTFGVGDCPIGVLNKNLTEIKLMNWLDVGEFGGGTRFITMPEIFSSDKFPTRFGYLMIEDFSYLMLMTDGIYDPKFVVEANLEKLESWTTFIDDLGGKNEDSTKVILDANNQDIANQLSIWMDFWSAGNHDDRTLAIVF